MAIYRVAWKDGITNRSGSGEPITKQRAIDICRTAKLAEAQETRERNPNKLPNMEYWVEVNRNGMKWEKYEPT